MQHITVYKGTEYHSAFPHIIRLQNGELVTIFRQTPFLKGSGVKGDAHEKLTHYHAAAGSRIALVRSTEDGLTWDPKSLVIVDASSGSNDLNMATIGQSSSGELVANNFRWIVNLTTEQVRAWAGRRHVMERPYEKEGYPFGGWALDGLYLIRSHDQGHTWGEPKPLAFGDLAYACSGGRNGFIELPDGTLLLPLNSRRAGEGTGRAFIARSYDGGRTWGQPSTVAYDPEHKIGFGEPPLARLPNGKLLTMMRTADNPYQAFSTDDGWTWQGLKRSSIWGFPCHLLPLRSGRVLCAYGYRREPYGVRAVLSEDEGETWDMEHEIIIRDDGMHRDLGYPASLQLKDGRILTTYYFHGRDGVRYIGGSIYTEEDALK